MKLWILSWPSDCEDGAHEIYWIYFLWMHPDQTFNANQHK